MFAKVFFYLHFRIGCTIRQTERYNISKNTVQAKFKSGLESFKGPETIYCVAS